MANVLGNPAEAGLNSLVLRGFQNALFYRRVIVKIYITRNGYIID